MPSREACSHAQADQDTTKTAACAVCGDDDLRPFFEAGDVPVHIGVQWPTVKEATSCRRGDITLAMCPTCGFMTNIDFDESLVAYEGVYENSLHFSPLFQEYAQHLAEHLVERYDIRDKDIIEIGCGHGEFLELLCTIGDNRGTGFDPGLPPECAKASGRARLIKGEFGPADGERPMDLVCCRQVLEHIHDPVAFLRIVHEAIGDRTKTIVFFEVPDFIHAFNTLSIWDIIYEHCSYFGPTSLQHAFAAAGFETLDLRSYYGDTFLGIEARASASGGAPELPPASPLTPDAIASFETAWRSKLADWEHTLDGYAQAGRRAVLWGAGARAVTFLNMLNGHGAIDRVVDVNPRKQGLHLAGTGQRIVDPGSLAESPPDVVILTNGMYRNEIEASLEAMGLHPEITLA